MDNVLGRVEGVHPPEHIVRQNPNPKEICENLRILWLKNFPPCSFTGRGSNRDRLQMKQGPKSSF